MKALIIFDLSDEEPLVDSQIEALLQGQKAADLGRFACFTLTGRSGQLRPLKPRRGMTIAFEGTDTLAALKLFSRRVRHAKRPLPIRQDGRVHKTCDVCGAVSVHSFGPEDRNPYYCTRISCQRVRARIAMRSRSVGEQAQRQSLE